MYEYEVTPQQLDSTGARVENLPDLLGLDLEGLRTLRHPVLDEVLADLRTRIDQSSETLWSFARSV
ncbi:FXSXX-COOH protein [Streptomyces sp. NPDC014892]|uniref:FXSXX-COOH protein n=1 Tax=Streptomyces sp. NPDC014892 TaxID=3364930 RepID=UPI0036FD8923